jgi:hypothetical protein
LGRGCRACRRFVLPVGSHPTRSARPIRRLEAGPLYCSVASGLAANPKSSQTRELQAVSRDRQRLLHAKVACESRLRAVLETYHPAPLHLFSERDRDITLEFISAYPTPGDYP